MSENKFLKDWKKHYREIFQTMYPQLEKKELNNLLDKVIAEKLVDPKAKIHNNYVHQEIDVSLLSVIDWVDKTKPIVGGFGVFFKNQSEVLNPAAVMLSNFLKLRKTYKSQLKNHKETSYEYATFDRMQATEKINANSYYGASGAPSSNFFNIYTATSVTAIGQSLISTTEQAFEAFLSNSVQFTDLDDCINFMENIKKDKITIDDSFLPNVSVELLMSRLSETFYKYEESYSPLLFKYIMRLSQSTINRIYFKNNLYAFSYLPKIRYKLSAIMKKTNEFKDPNKLPEETEDEIKDLWMYYKDFVLYNHFSFGRINRLKKDKRKTVVVVDTDSNMLNLNPWVEFLTKNVVSVNDKLLSRNIDTLRFIGINMMCYFITNMVTEVLWKYTKWSNIPKDYRSLINMKNEYLFTRLILTDKKKRYIGSIRLREGKEIYPEKIEIKGMDFVKSSTREDTKKYFTKMVEDKILYADNVSIPEILKGLEDFEKIIETSLRKGEKNFLIPKSVKELEAYNDAFREQGVRGVLVWNYLYPENPIQLPEKIDIIKMKLVTKEDVEKVKDVDPKFYNIIMKNIFNNKNPKIADKGVQVIGIPRNVETVPEWLLPFIDYDTIVNDNLKRFYSVLESLGIETIKTSKKDYFSNILKL